MDGAFGWWLFVVSIGASGLGGMLGMASGIFIVPILVLFAGIDFHLAIGASLVSVIACSCASAAPLLEARLTHVRLAIVLEVATTLGALTGVFLVGILPLSFLYLLFAAVLAISAQQMLANRRDPVATAGGRMGWADRLGLHATQPDESTGEDLPYRVERLPLGLSLMYGAGLISALLGIGSGVLKIPAMDTALRLPIKTSSATSNFMIGVTAAASAGAYLLRGDLVPAIVGPVALGSVLGSILGARLLVRIRRAQLRILFVAILVALAVLMFLSAFGVIQAFGGPL